jgi:hypothetical protein
MSLEIHVTAPSGFTMVCYSSSLDKDVKSIINFIVWHFTELEEDMTIIVYGTSKKTVILNKESLNSLRAIMDSEKDIPLVESFVSFITSREDSHEKVYE